MTTTKSTPQGKRAEKKTLTVCLSQPKIAQRPQIIHIGSVQGDTDVVCISAQFRFKPFYNGADNNELKFAVSGVQLNVETLVGKTYEINKICRVIGSNEIIVELQTTSTKPKSVDFNFDEIVYKPGERFKFQLMTPSGNEAIKNHCANIYVV